MLRLPLLQLQESGRLRHNRQHQENHESVGTVRLRRGLPLRVRSQLRLAGRSERPDAHALYRVDSRLARSPSSTPVQQSTVNWCRATPTGHAEPFSVMRPEGPVVGPEGWHSSSYRIVSYRGGGARGARTMRSPVPLGCRRCFLLRSTKQVDRLLFCIRTILKVLIWQRQLANRVTCSCRIRCWELCASDLGPLLGDQPDARDAGPAVSRYRQDSAVTARACVR